VLEETNGIESLAQIVANTLQQYAGDNVDEAKDLYGSIILVGCGSLLEGLGERMQNEIKELAPARFDINVFAAKERGYYPWIGGSILGSLNTFSKMWISKPEYEESGPNIVNRKCF